MGHTVFYSHSSQKFLINKFIALILCCVLFNYILSLSTATTVSFRHATTHITYTVGVLLILSYLLDYYRQPAHVCFKNQVLIGDLLTLSIGIMLVIQVYADIALDWFTPQGYSHLILAYAKTTQAPEWFKVILIWVLHHASIFRPIQFIVESSFALSLTVIVWRIPMLLGTSALLYALMLSELGVSATSVTTVLASTPRTWIWDFLFPATACLILACMRIGYVVNNKNIWRTFFSDRVTLFSRFIFAALAGGLTWGIANYAKAGVFGENPAPY